MVKREITKELLITKLDLLSRLIQEEHKNVKSVSYKGTLFEVEFLNNLIQTFNPVWHPKFKSFSVNQKFTVFFINSSILSFGMLSYPIPVKSSIDQNGHLTISYNH